MKPVRPGAVVSGRQVRDVVHWGPFAARQRPNAAYDYFDMKTDAAARADFKKYAEQFHPKALMPPNGCHGENAGAKYVVLHRSTMTATPCSTALTDFDMRLPALATMCPLVEAARAAV